MPEAEPGPQLSGEELPELRTAIPGPRSRALAIRLGAVESRNITRIADDAPIFWDAARGAAVRDVDGNVYVDLTSGFGVATAGHANPRVTAAIAHQAARLPHALGDVHPAGPKLALLERLAAIAPGDLSVGILGSAGAEAVEAALKTAVLHTGRTGVLAFEGAYHGLTYGALSATWRADFRDPFRRQLSPGVRFAPYPAASAAAASGAHLEHALRAIETAIGTAEGGPHPIGAILVEPILGRGGLVVPAPGFLAALRDLCDGRSRILIFDEIYSGIGRTGAWFCCEHEGVLPDVIVIGKALTGSLPLSAAIGSPAVMSAWPPSAGEAIHTSTFLGNPIACAAALAQLDEIEERGLIARAALLGDRIAERAAGWVRGIDGVLGAQGRGLLQGIRLGGAGGARALEVCRLAQERGVLVLAEGAAADVLAITPPAVITDEQLDAALAVLEAALRATV